MTTERGRRVNPPIGLGPFGGCSAGASRTARLNTIAQQWCGGLAEWRKQLEWMVREILDEKRAAIDLDFLACLPEDGSVVVPGSRLADARGAVLAEVTRELFYPNRINECSCGDAFTRR